MSHTLFIAQPKSRELESIAENFSVERDYLTVSFQRVDGVTGLDSAPPAESFVGSLLEDSCSIDREGGGAVSFRTCGEVARAARRESLILFHHPDEEIRSQFSQIAECIRFQKTDRLRARHGLPGREVRFPWFYQLFDASTRKLLGRKIERLTEHCRYVTWWGLGEWGLFFRAFSKDVNSLRESLVTACRQRSLVTRVVNSEKELPSW